MIAIRKEKSMIPFHEVVTFEAKKDEDVTFGSFLGDKIFWVDEGDRVLIRVKKSECIEVGDEVNLGWLVQQAQTKFKWNWTL